MPPFADSQTRRGIFEHLADALDREDLTAAREHLQELAESESSLHQERRLLARRVAARTADLSAANAKLARASRTKDEFLASVSHELRTPLNGILSISETLQEELYGPLTNRQKRSLGMIEESGRHLLVLITDLLDLSKVEAGKLRLHLQAVDPRQVCRTSLAMIHQTAQRKGIEITTRYPDPSPLVRADERRLKQILVNLLANAVKFTPEGGQVGLEVDALEDQDTVVLKVWDTGLGIDPNRAQELFKPFSQLDTGFDRNYAGTGLGLALVARMTEMQGGCVELESSGLNHGCSFSVRLPVGGPTKVAPPLETSDQERSLRPQILLAEDNEATLTALGLALTGAGFRLTVARHGGEALDRLREERPQAAIMDLQMPVLSGLESCRRLRRVPELETLPVLGLTSLVVPGDEAACRSVGIHRVLRKPVAPHLLVETLRQELARAAGGAGRSGSE